ncbi:ribosome-releasing factor 2, mitochondrial [Prorops nasuta]|uniref:ribosome-releasing factor 2, mitochondrial n=1 Tax=Prorops nasuta TaxID=863751 RepID=UPI0034CF8D92
MLLKRRIINSSWCQLRTRFVHESQKDSIRSTQKKNDVSKVRNIGILAHIDAGKTTTTERMLFYSGLISDMGEVHHGNTVTDYMDQERERGITITSAAVTFNWKNHRFNLIDTPGHIDFTMEVEQTLRVLDGSIVILDGSAGVEAQTLTVCNQADKYNIPRIFYVNKMDRPDADFEMSVGSIETKLGTDPLPLQIPIKQNGNLIGILDLVFLEIIQFDSKSQGANIIRSKLDENKSSKLWEKALKKRCALVDKLSSIDDTLAEIIIQEESLENIGSNILIDSLQRVTIDRKAAPVLLGSSYKNIGIQPLMDSVIFYLPSPDKSHYESQYRCFKGDVAARVFKVIHDKQRGQITFFRLYNGNLKKGDKVYNAKKEKTEIINRLYAAYADDYEEINEVHHGNIGAAAGLISASTGDLLTNSSSAINRAKKILEQEKKLDLDDPGSIFNIGARVPDAVFFCSIEPPSLSYQTALDTALEQLSKEDPSLRVRYDEETGQIVLSGMGELHLEIIRERIRKDYKINADLGPLQIAYKETIQSSSKDTHIAEHKIGESNHKVTVTISVIPNYEKQELLTFDNSADSASNISAIQPKIMQAVRNGIKTGLLHGPLLGCPLINVGVKLHWLEVLRGTSLTMVTAAVTQSIRKLLQKSNPVLLEPIMNLEIITSEEHSSAIIGDLSKRRGEIKNIDIRGRNKVIESKAPLAELLGYSTAMRKLTSGTASFTLEFSHYKIMDPYAEKQAVRNVTGFS